MTAPETRAVIEALTADGAQVRFVGGCVRDAIAGRPVKDIDIATHDEPEVVMKLLQRAGLRAIPTGIDHGTVTAVVDRAHFEITTLREDVETFGRRARIAFTDDWMADASRRDFTFNALFCAPDGTLFDPFGGIADLKAGRVRFVGDPETRIREDVLRLLRFFRFHAYYGAGEPDVEGLAACKRLAELLPSLSAERVAAEMLRLLAAPDPSPIVALMIREKILAPILPELTNAQRLAALVKIEPEFDAPDPLRRLAAVIGSDGVAAASIARRLRFSNKQAEELVALAARELAVTPSEDKKLRRRELYRLNADLYRDRVLLLWADEWANEPVNGGGPNARNEKLYRALLAEAKAWKAVEFPVAGRDALALGVTTGPEIGRLLQAVEEWWIEGDFQAGRDECLKKLRALAGR